MAEAGGGEREGGGMGEGMQASTAINIGEKFYNIQIPQIIIQFKYTFFISL